MINFQNSSLSNNIYLRRYLFDRVEVILFFLIFLASFFQMFPFYVGIFRVTYYFSTFLFVIYLSLQFMRLEAFNFNKPILFIYFIFFCWLLYGLGSLFFITNHEDGFWLLHLRFMYFFNFYVITQFLISKKRIEAYKKIILICIVWSLGVCIWEMITLQHLPGSKFYNVPHYVPTSAFMNENDLPAIILICCPILLFMKSKFLRYLSSVVLLIFFIITFVQSTRTVLIVLFPFFVYHFVKKTNWIYKLITIACIVSTLSLLLNTVPVFNFMVRKHLRERVFSFGLEARSQLLDSKSVRQELYILSLEKLVDSKGLGIGIGNFEKSSDPNRLLSTGGIDIAHSVFAETLGSEGIIGLFLLCLIVFSLLFPIIKTKSRDSVLSLFRIKTLADAEKQVLTFLIFFVASVSVPASVRGYMLYWGILGYNYALIYTQETDSSSLLSFDITSGANHDSIHEVL